MIHIFKKINMTNSSSIAKDRLKLLLISDRANCSPEIMNLIKNDLVNVISKYMDVDRESLEVSMINTKRNDKLIPTLYANIPIKSFINK